MGAHLARRYITERDTEPDPERKFEFDPNFGFEERKERGLSALTCTATQTPFVNDNHDFTLNPD